MTTYAEPIATAQSSMQNSFVSAVGAWYSENFIAYDAAYRVCIVFCVFVLNFV